MSAMPRSLPILLLSLMTAALVTGCHKPILVRNEGSLRMDAEMNTRMLTPRTFSLPDLIVPVVAVPLGGEACCPESGKIAVIDLDGPLVNAHPPSLGPDEPSSLALFQQKLDAVAATPGVRAVVLRL